MNQISPAPKGAEPEEDPDTWAMEKLIGVCEPILGRRKTREKLDHLLLHDRLRLKGYPLDFAANELVKVKTFFKGCWRANWDEATVEFMPEQAKAGVLRDMDAENAPRRFRDIRAFKADVSRFLVELQELAPEEKVRDEREGDARGGRPTHESDAVKETLLTLGFPDKPVPTRAVKADVKQRTGLSVSDKTVQKVKRLMNDRTG